MDDELRKQIRIFALDNARKYGGEANVGSTTGSTFAAFPEAKKNAEEVIKEVIIICSDVSKLSVEEQTEELQKTAPERLEQTKVKEVRTLKPLPNAEQGEVVLRIAPSPSGPNHIGHAFTFMLSHLYAKKYEGKLHLRIEDTNPENIYLPAYKMIEDDWKWLTEGGIDDVQVQSDHMKDYYDHGFKLIEGGGAYVCTCDADSWRELITKKEACPCRELPKGDQLTRWDKMFVGFEPGESVVRMKTDIQHKNPAMRDFALFRINHSKHPRVGTKFRVWPLMNFSVTVDDHKFGVTHTIRGKDHIDNGKRQQFIYDFFEWTAPEHVYVGKINFEGMKVKTSKTKEDIQHGKFDGWDDIRLPFIAALRRRGFQPGAFQQFAKDIGLGQNDKKVPIGDFFKSLEAHNRRILDPVASRYFFVPDPIEVDIEGAPQKEVKLKLHPDDKSKGSRVLRSRGSFLLPKDDYDAMNDEELYRLIDLCNVKFLDGKLVFDSEDLAKYRAGGKGSVQWLPKSDDLFEVELLMPDKSKRFGKGEPSLKDVKVGEVVQLERVGFCRVDKKEGKKVVFWFAHK